MEPSDDCSSTPNPLKSKTKTASNCSISIAIDNVVGNYKEDDNQLLPEASFKTISKSSSKSNSANTKSTTKSTSKSANSKGSLKSSAKSISKTSTPKSSKTANGSSRKLTNDGDELDPAMYLDPTITITLVNNDAEKKRPSKVANIEPPSSISSSDLQVCSGFYISLLFDYELLHLFETCICYL